MTAPQRNANDSAALLIRRLRAIARDLPDLADAARLYEAILPLQRDADPFVGLISLHPDDIYNKIEKGEPLLHGIDLEIDAETVRELAINITRAVEHATAPKFRLRLPWSGADSRRDVSARSIRKAIQENRMDMEELLPKVAAGDHAGVATTAERAGLDSEMVLMIVQNALIPVLRACLRRVAPLVSGAPWEKRACFVCGAPATLGELRKNSQEKHLRCGSCGADWRVRRLRCESCGNEDHKTLRYFTSESGPGGMRIEACDHCKTYLKVIPSFDPTDVEMLAIVDLETRYLDTIARDRGYARPGSPLTASPVRSEM